MRIFLRGELKVFNRLIEALFRSLVPVITAFQVIFVTSRTDRAGAGQLLLLFGSQTYSDLVDDRAGHLALQGENVSQWTFIGIRPEMAVSRDPYQLRGDSHPISSPQHRAFDNCVHVQIMGDLRK